jgi:hypothetical protein
MSIPSKQVYIFNAISFKIQMILFEDIEKLILKSIQNFKEPQSTKTILKKRTKLKDTHFLISKLTAKLR